MAPHGAQCWRCGTDYDSSAWLAIQVIERIEAEDVRRLLLNWPHDLAIEVRQCAQCGAPIARKRGGISPQH